MKIANLADYPEFIEEVSALIWEEWSKKSGKSLEEEIYQTKHSLTKDRIPQMHIAINNNELIGVVSLWNNDLRTRQDLIPWMAGLYIKPEYRNKGIGTLLQQRCIEVVKELKYKKLYLYTNHTDYYEKLGWKFLETAPFKGETTKIYEYIL